MSIIYAPHIYIGIAKICQIFFWILDVGLRLTRIAELCYDSACWNYICDNVKRNERLTKYNL